MDSRTNTGPGNPQAGFNPGTSWTPNITSRSILPLTPPKKQAQKPISKTGSAQQAEPKEPSDPQHRKGLRPGPSSGVVAGSTYCTNLCQELDPWHPTHSEHHMAAWYVLKGMQGHQHANQKWDPKRAPELGQWGKHLLYHQAQGQESPPLTLAIPQH